MKIRKVVAATAALAISAVLLAGCGGEQQDPETLRILAVKHPLTKPMAEMEWVNQIQEATGATIEWEEVSADWPEKKATMLAAGDVPDLIIGGNAITDTDLATYSSLFLDLSEHMEAMPNVAAMFEENSRLEALATLPSGEVYSLPSYKRFWPLAITRMYINQQWLDDLGLEVPTTWDELFTVLSAFKTEDANGNGDPNDEIPWDWAPVGTGGFGYFQPSALLGSTGLPINNGGGQGYFVEGGEVSNFMVDERYRDLVAFMHEAWAAGLISEQAFTQDYSAYQSVGRGNGDDAAVGFSWGWTASDRFGAQLAPQYTSMAQIEAEAGQDAPVTWSYDDENYTGNHIIVSAESNNQELALAVVNEFYDQTRSVEVLFGDVGDFVEQTGDNSYRVLPPSDGTSDPSSWKWTNSLADAGPFWIRESIELELPTDVAEAVEQAIPLQPALDNVDPEADVYPFKFVKMTAEDLNTLNLNNTNVLAQTMAKFAEWVTQGGVEEQWDDYVTQMDGLGMPENIEIYQRYYDEFVANQ